MRATKQYTLSLQNGEIYVQELYNNSDTYSNKTMQYSEFTNNDVFAISNSWVYGGYGDDVHTDGLQWIRVRTPPPNNIFPQQQ